MKKIISIIVLIGIIGLAVFLFSNKDTVQEAVTETAQAQIDVVTVGELEAQTEPIVAYGQVVSSNSVAVVPETSGVVKRVTKSLGQTVRAGEVVIELQNLSEQQAVLQAQSSLSSSQASLARVNRGADIDQIAQAQAAVTAAESNLVATETSVLSGLDGMYAELDVLITSAFGEFFSNPNSSFPSFSFIKELDTLKIDEISIPLEDKLQQLNERFEQDKKYEDVDDALDVISAHINAFDTYTESLRDVVTAFTPSPTLSAATITRWENDLNVVQNELASKRVTLKGYESQVLSSKNNVLSSTEVLKELENGSDREDIVIAQSGVTGAQAGLGSARIQLEKTLIKAPTFGRISSIETRVGELVGPSAPIFVLSSSDAKRIDVFLTEKEVAQVQVGSSVVIDGVYEGTVARVAPTIDSQTGKIKVEIFADETITLTEGVGVGVAIESKQNTRGFSIPIEAVFVRGDQAYVYAVESGKAVPTPVETEGLFGPVVVITSGITADTTIVSFARIVKDNQIITEESAQVEDTVESVN